MDKEKFLKFPQFCDVKEQQPKGFFQWIDFMQKNKPQVNALAAGVMLMVYGGSQIGWGIFNNHIEVQTWSGGFEDAGTKFYVIASFFFAVIGGLLIGSLIVDRYSKLSIYIATSILSIVSSILLILEPSDVYVITLSRSFGGFSHGVAYLTVLIHASEVAIAKLRGMVVGAIHFCIMIGVFMTSSSLIPIYKTRSYETDPTQTIGFNGLICIITGLLLAIIFNRESPVFLIKKYQEKKALETMIRLRSESHETASVRWDFNEFRVMVKEDKDFSMNIFNYCHQMLLVIFLKFIFVATFNMRINNYFLNLAKLNFYDAMEDFTGFYLIGTRWAVMMITMMLMDYKRIPLFLISSIGSGLILLCLTFNEVSDETILADIVALTFQFFAGIAVGIMPDIYSIDAVNTRIKPFFIALTSISENLLQIFFIVDFFYFNIDISIVMAVFGILLILAIIARPFNTFFTILPDTSRLSLRLARDAFRL